MQNYLEIHAQMYQSKVKTFFFGGVGGGGGVSGCGGGGGWSKCLFFTLDTNLK